MSSIEKDIKAAGADKAPRVTPNDLSANIVAEHYFTAADGATAAHVLKGANDIPLPDVKPLELLTFCVLILRNGFTVTGESACASPENFDAEIGRKIARENAVQKVWPLMGYALKEKLFTAPPPRATILDVCCSLDVMTNGWKCRVTWSDDTTTEGGGLSQAAAVAIARLKKYPDLKD